MKREKVILESEGYGWILSPTKAIQVLRARKSGKTKNWALDEKIRFNSSCFDVFHIQDLNDEEINMMMRIIKERKLKKVV